MKKTLLAAVMVVAFFYGLRWWTQKAQAWHENVDDEWRKVSSVERLYPR